jgi:hypothetical protein
MRKEVASKDSLDVLYPNINIFNSEMKIVVELDAFETIFMKG